MDTAGCVLGRGRPFKVQGKHLKTFYYSVVASTIFYIVEVQDIHWGQKKTEQIHQDKQLFLG